MNSSKLSFFFNHKFSNDCMILLTNISAKMSVPQNNRGNTTLKTQIRPYIPSDLNELILSWETANQLAHPFLKKAFVDNVRNDIPNLYLPNADTWVAVVNEHVIGFIALIGNEVGAIFVNPTHHGQGVGKLLMDKAVSVHGELELDVFKNNHIGREFYKRYGFVPLREFYDKNSGQQTIRLGYKKESTERRPSPSKFTV